MANMTLRATGVFVSSTKGQNVILIFLYFLLCLSLSLSIQYIYICLSLSLFLVYLSIQYIYLVYIYIFKILGRSIHKKYIKMYMNMEKNITFLCLEYKVYIPQDLRLTPGLHILTALEQKSGPCCDMQGLRLNTVLIPALPLSQTNPQTC